MVRLCLIEYRSFRLGGKRDDDVRSAAASQIYFGSHSLPNLAPHVRNRNWRARMGGPGVRKHEESNSKWLAAIDYVRHGSRDAPGWFELHEPLIWQEILESLKVGERVVGERTLSDVASFVEEDVHRGAGRCAVLLFWSKASMLPGTSCPMRCLNRPSSTLRPHSSFPMLRSIRSRRTSSVVRTSPRLAPLELPVPKVKHCYSVNMLQHEGPHVAIPVRPHKANASTRGRGKPCAW